MIQSPAFYAAVLRPLLFTLPPETAQSIAEFALRRQWLWQGFSRAFRARNDRLAVDLAGLKLSNPVGLAAGYDKDCEMLTSMTSLGFGYVSGGTVVGSAQPGNPRPRVLRYRQERSLINSLGFPSRGLDYAMERLESRKKSDGTPVVVSISGVDFNSIFRCHRGLEPLADAIELNISSPNTAGLKLFQEPQVLSELLGRISDGRERPLFVKLPPYEAGNDEARDRTLALVNVCVRHGVDALTVANTHPRQDARLAVGTGGLSGKAIFDRTIEMVSAVRSEAGSRTAINACGGIFTGQDAWKALKAGATTVQLLTGLVYRGPGIARTVNRELLREMDRDGVGALRASAGSEE